CVGLALHFGEMIFLPTVIALLGTAFLWPFVHWLNQGLLLPGVCVRRSFPWVVPCIVTWRVPWGLGCTVAVLGLFVLTLLVPAGFSLVIPRMLQRVRNQVDQQQVYEQCRQQLFRLGVPPDPQYLPENAEDSVIFESVRAALDPSKPFLVPTLYQTAL